MKNRIERENGFEKPEKECRNEKLLGKDLQEKEKQDVKNLRNDEVFQEFCEKRRETRRDCMVKIQLKCPVCGRRLIDAASGTQSELKEEEKMQHGWIPDYIQKCAGCKKTIAIRKVS